MARLPTPGGDEGSWGAILNEYLRLEHNADGTHNIALGGALSGSTQNAQLADGSVTDATIAGAANIAQTKISNLVNDLAAKADNTNLVHISGSETITGAKTFSASPIVPLPTASGDVANKAYVDGVAGSGSTPDADSTTKGKVQLAGDLGGTAAAPTVPALTTKASSTITVTGTQSLTGGGDLTTNRTFSLVGDTASPGNNQYYGTDASGTKGYYTLPTGGGGGANSDAVYTVAANNTPATLKANADFVCDGTSDNVEIQQAIDTVAQSASGGGEVVLLQGTYDISGTISIGHPSDGVNSYRIHLRFERGAKVRWTTVTGTTPLIKVESSDCLVSNPWLQGSGSKGNGYGLVFGGDTTNFGGRYTKTVYRSSVQNLYAINLSAGIVFAVDRTGSSSSGDNTLFGGYITNCVDGILSAGFTNRVYGITIATCDNCLHGTGDRNSHMIEVFGATFNQWSNAAVYLEKDKGSTFVNLWSEHTSAQSAVPQQAILLGNTTNSSYTANNTRFVGTTSVTLFDETYAVRHVRSQNVVFENLSMSTNGTLPLTAINRFDATHSGTTRYQRTTFQTGTIPAGWSYSLLSSKDPSSTGTLICEAIPGAAGATTNTTVGDKTPKPSKGTYYIDVSGSPSNATYWAKSASGHIAMLSADTSTTSGLKTVLESLAANGVHFEFGANRYHFLDAPLGNESYAGSQDHASFGTTSPPMIGLTFSGAGMKSTVISNRTNWSGAADTEPFSFTNCQYTTIRDLAVESCGFYKSTTDAIDCDQGAYNLIERVRITRSRSRGIVMDGGDPGKNATGNTIRDCIISGRPEKPGLGLVAGGSLAASTTYRYLVSWVDMDLAGVNTAGETKPSEEASIITDATNKSVRVNLPIGPYTTSQRKVYRAPAGSPSWVLVTTINDNTTTTYTDTGAAGSGVTMPVSNSSTIPQAGIELLGASGNLVEGNLVDGIGDITNGASQYGINLVRKGSGSSTVNSDNNKVTNNTVLQSGSHGIRIFGGSNNTVTANLVSNPGTVAVKAQALRVDGVAGATTNNNLLAGNRTIENQDANSWSTGKSTSNVITVTSAGTPTGNTIEGNIIDVGASATTISDSGTASVIRANKGFNPQGVAAITVGASPFTYTAGPTPEAVYISGGTVSDISKNSISLFTISPATIYLEPNESIVVTYSGTPVMIKDRK